MPILETERSRAEVFTARGALVGAWSVGGHPVLFLDQNTLNDLSKNVRGGVPLLFPFAGKPPDGSPLPQHGFARRMPWELTAHTQDTLACRLRSTDETRAAWPHDFELTYRVQLHPEALHLEWLVHNSGTTPLPLHFGIHPYFQLGSRAGVRVEGASGRAFDNTTGLEREVPAIDFGAGEVDLHFAAPPSGHATLHRGDGHKVRLRWSPHFTRLVIWALPGQPFVCVEPWTAPGRAAPLHHVAPGATERLWVELGFES